VRLETIILAAGIVTLLVGGVHASQRGNEPSFADKLFAKAKADDYLGDEGCADCHGDKVANFHESPHMAYMQDPKLPHDKKGCEGCHGPGQFHIDEEHPEIIAFRKMSPKESSAACLRCHKDTLSEMHWNQSAHAHEDMSCVSCHQIHSDSEPVFAKNGMKKGKADDPRRSLFVAKPDPKAMLMFDEVTLCGQCHAGSVAQFKLNSHHPIPEGRMVCSDCHSVHPNKKDKTKLHDWKGDCVSCHTEYAGPFIYEHDPVAGHAGEGCVECHKPHGSGNPKMLNSFSRGLCAQCHTEKLSTHYPGRTCWQSGCHVAPHGSNRDPHLLQP
jgi:predicted CXXCH cytochrome family protein